MGELSCDSLIIALHVLPVMVSIVVNITLISFYSLQSAYIYMSPV